MIALRFHLPIVQAGALLRGGPGKMSSTNLKVRFWHLAVALQDCDERIAEVRIE